MNNYSKTRAGVVGATGYAGQELVRLLLRHEGTELVAAMDSGRGARGAGLTEIAGSGPGAASPAAMRAAAPDVVFLATPPEISMVWARELLGSGGKDLTGAGVNGAPRVVDLSGAFRFPDTATFTRWYGMAHAAPELLAGAVYGWTERFRAQIRDARLVANPGCYATAAAVALWPPVSRGCAATGAAVVCDAKSGASGAGKEPREDLSFVELAGNCKAYSVPGHRHTPEIAAQAGLSLAQFTFTPHLLPVTRGILATTYIPLRAGAGAEELGALYEEAYAGNRFLRLRGDHLPELKDVVGTNYCDLGWRIHAEARQAVVVTCLDNLLKGAAGQAVQNMNCMFGWPEETGLL